MPSPLLFSELTESQKNRLQKLSSSVPLRSGFLYFLAKQSPKEENFFGFAVVSLDPKPQLEAIFIEEKFRFALKGSKLIRGILNFCARENQDSLWINSEAIQKKEGSEEFFRRVGFEEKDGFWFKSGLLTRKIRFRKTLFAVGVTVVVNTFLMTIKLATGYLSGSQGAIADGIQTLMDNLNSAILFLTSYISYREADEDHPFGHSNIEHIASLMIGTWLIATSFSLASDAVISLWSPREIAFPLQTLAVIAFSVIAKWGLYLYKLKSARDLKDPSLLADAIEHRADVFSSLGVLVGIYLSFLGYPMADSLAGLGIALLIARESYKILKTSIDRLMNRQEADQVEQIRRIVRDYPSVQNVHDIRIKYDGNQLFIFLDVRLPRELSLTESHEICHAIEEKVKASMEDVEKVFVHSEPTMK